MSLAVSVMGATPRFLFYLAALICFIIAAIAPANVIKVNLVGAGLALFVIPFMWDALAAT